MKKTKMKRGKGGLIAFLAAGVLMVNVVPARAEEGWWDWLLPLVPVVLDYVMNSIEPEKESGGSERIPCWSAGYPLEGATYVSCASCTVVEGHFEGSNAKCTRRY